MLRLGFDPVPLAHELVATVRADLYEVFIGNCVVEFVANAVVVLAISAYEAVWLSIDCLSGATTVTKPPTCWLVEALTDQSVEVTDNKKKQTHDKLPATEATQAHQRHKDLPAAEELPRTADYAYETFNVSFTLKLHMQCDKMACIFASNDERAAVSAILSAVHGLNARLCFRKWLVPYTRMLLQRCDGDETRAFAHIAANPHLFDGLQAKTEQETWCWTRHCCGCNKPRHKFDVHDDEIRGMFTYI